MPTQYSAPVLTEFGSIAATTFATPNNGGISPSSSDFIPTADLGNGNYACGPTAGSANTGGKNWMDMQCDWFGEYSHS